jgi:hypothetical protein
VERGETSVGREGGKKKVYIIWKVKSKSLWGGFVSKPFVVKE